jgi:hypothetical protein
MYALFKDGEMISKPHSTQDACAAEAFKLGLVKQMPRITEVILADGVSIHNLDRPAKP